MDSSARERVGIGLYVGITFWASMAFRLTRTLAHMFAGSCYPKVISITKVHNDSPKQGGRRSFKAQVRTIQPHRPFERLIQILSADASPRDLLGFVSGGPSPILSRWDKSFVR